MQWFKLTDICKTYKRKPNDLLKTQYISGLIAKYDAKVKIVRGGNNKNDQGTWINSKIIYKEICTILDNSNTGLISFKRAEHVFGEDIISNLFQGYTIIPQFKVGNYKIDWYIKDLNLAIEFDEPGHNSKIEYDTIRQRFIEKKLKCKFLRYTFKI